MRGKFLLPSRKSSHVKTNTTRTLSAILLLPPSWLPSHHLSNQILVYFTSALHCFRHQYPACQIVLIHSLHVFETCQFTLRFPVLATFLYFPFRLHFFILNSAYFLPNVVNVSSESRLSFISQHFLNPMVSAPQRRLCKFSFIQIILHI